MIESLPLSVTRISTLLGERSLTNATGFFFEREGSLCLVTSRHVVLDEPSEHHPDRIEIELHVNPVNLGETVQFSIPLYRDGKSIWREGLERQSEIVEGMSKDDLAQLRHLCLLLVEYARKELGK